MRLDPLLYAHPLTGAVMPVTTDLLSETYLAPRAEAWDIGGALTDPSAPWATRLKIAPTETQDAVERALRGVMHATPGLDPATLTPDRLPSSRAKRHMEALRNVWAETGTLPEDLAVIRHVLSCTADLAVAPLPVLDLGDDPFSTPAEAALAVQLCRHHGSAPSDRLEAWRASQPQGAAAGAISHMQRNLLGGAPTMARDATLGFFALRDSLAEAQFAAALARRMLEDGRAAQASDIALLVPETPTRLAHLAEAFADQGVPLSGLPESAGLRDLAGEFATLVTDLFLKVTAYLRRWAEALPDAAQALADLARLEALAEEFDTSDPGMMTAAGFHGRGARVFLGWLASRLEERDFDRHPDPDAGAVPGIEIVTWHAAKGREWPVVAVCELEIQVGERENTTRALFTDFSDLSRVLDTARLIHTPRLFSPEQREVFLADRQLAAEAEARNLIYVALTRARNRLVIEWPAKALDKEANCLTLLAQAGVSLGAGLIVCGQEFPARSWRYPAGEGMEQVTAAAQPLLRFGAPSPTPVKARTTPWRRRPSTLTEGPALPAPPQVVPLGPAHATGRAQPATERGTAWHRAFRVMASRPDLASSLPAVTGLDAGALDAITAQVSALKDWLTREGYPDLHLEVPIHVTHPDGSETLGILDAVATGPGRMLVIDHKTGPAPDPRARFATYWPQLAAYADALRLTFPAHQLRRVAIHWMNESSLSFLPLEPEVVA